jgi:hypothetical protein
MASGQQRVYINNAERVVSDDQNLQSDFATRERNEFWRSLTQLTFSPGSPGVTIRSEGLVDYPLRGVVLDGLEAIVDNPGYVMISPGALAGWFGPPADAGRESGFLIVDSAGVSSLEASMVIVPNTGTVARCDIIEATIQGDILVTNENRDIYDQATGTFNATSVPKTIQSRIIFRVRTGTPGAPPVADYGWLPLALAIVQPGVSVAMVDFYDIRPLWREMGGIDKNLESMEGNVTVPDRGSNHQVIARGNGLFAGTAIDGIVQAKYCGIDLSGWLYRNVPINPTNLAQWGAATANVGGDGYGMALGTDIATRGTGLVVGPYNDTIVICACFPALGFGRPVPRCVRYTESAANNVTPNPPRRRPQGANGIIQIFSSLQEGYDLQYGRPYAATLSAPGIDGCLGIATCFPIGYIRVDDGGTIVPTATGVIMDANVGGGVAAASYQIMVDCDLPGHLDTTIPNTANYHDDALPGLPVPGTQFRDMGAAVGDRVEIETRNLVFTANTVGTGAFGYHFRVVEDVYGTPLIHDIAWWWPFDTSSRDQVSLPIAFTVTRAGTVACELQLYNHIGTEGRVYGPDTVWGRYRRVRP